MATQKIELEGKLADISLLDPQEVPLPCPSHSTAITILPPRALHHDINILRSVYDKSYPRWSPHITMAIPFVAAADLPVAVERIQTLFKNTDLLKPWDITFSKTGLFQHKDSATVYIQPDDVSMERLRRIRKALEKSFSLPSRQGDGVFRPHLTIGQTALNEAAFQLQEKAEMLLLIKWTFDSLVVLSKNELDEGRMEIAASISSQCTAFHMEKVPSSAQPAMPCCYYYDTLSQRYAVYHSTSLFDGGPPETMAISTYNILHSPHQPQTSSSPRLLTLVNIVSNLKSTIIVLQEVTDVAWQYFLSHPVFRERFPYISAPSHLPLPNHRNIVMLSTIPFKAHYLPLVTPHKPALIADVAGLTIAGVHLHAGLREEKLALKLKELSKLTTYLNVKTHPVIIAGDFNIPNISREYTAALPKIHEILAAYTDAWTEKPNGEGDTFTPDINQFAREGASVLCSQRHDRVYFSHRGQIQVIKNELFGFPSDGGALGSDHWGLSVDIRVNLGEKIGHHGEEEEMFTELEIPQTRWTDDEVIATLPASDIPDKDHDASVSAALALLSSILEPVKKQLPFQLHVVGSFALGAHTKTSDLDVLAISTISQKTFWEVFLQHLQRYKLTGNRIKVLRIIKAAKTPMVELLVDAIKVEIQYCCAGKLIPMFAPPKEKTNHSWDQVTSFGATSDCLNLPAPVLKQLNAYRDNQLLLNLLPNIEVFRLARRAFKYFCSQRGIYGSKFGFLGGYAITLLIAGVCRVLPPHASAAEVLATAFARYVEFPWETDILWFPGVEKGRSKREDRDIMFISSINRPCHNAMRNASRSTLCSIIHELRYATDKKEQNFNDVCADGLNEFFNNRHFIKIQCAFWGLNSADGRKRITWIESRLVILLVNLAKSVPELETRLWPARFGDCASDDVQGIYLVGVLGTGVDEVAFRAVLRDVERTLIREDEVVDRWVSVTVVKGKEIRAEKLQVDSRTWDGEEDIVLDEEMDEEIDDEDERTLSPPEVTVTPEVKTGKLRPSHDIYNRLLWDEGYTADEYVVGYEDRFKGVREMPLMSWKREFTDEEFIPFHRVVYFREKALDGKIVWDRRTRVDLIFRSG